MFHQGLRSRGKFGVILLGFGLCLSFMSGCALLDAFGGDEELQQDVSFEDVNVEDAGSDPGDTDIDTGDVGGNHDVESDVGDVDEYFMCGGDGDPRKVVELSVGHRHACALMGDCTVSCWGNNRFGQLGRLVDDCVLDDVNNYYTKGQFSECYSDTPVTVPGLKRVKSVSAGAEHTCAVYLEENDDTQGRVKCWGGNRKGQVDGNPKPYAEPIVELRAVGHLAQDSVLAVSAGRFHTCAMVEVPGEPHGVKCWGDDSMKQLNGNGKFEYIGYEEVGAFHRLTVDAMTHSKQDHMCVVEQIDDVGAVWCWGLNSGGQVGVEVVPGETNVNQSVVPNILAPRIGEDDELLLSSGYVNTCIAIRGTNELHCWGKKDSLANIDEYRNSGAGGREGYGDFDWSYVFNEEVHDITAGNGFMCVVLGNGSVKCWGYARECQLGIQTGGDFNPKEVTISSFGGSIPERVSAGESFACALAGHDVWCWGAQNFPSYYLQPFETMCQNVSNSKVVF